MNSTKNNFETVILNIHSLMLPFLRLQCPETADKVILRCKTYVKIQFLFLELLVKRDKNTKCGKGNKKAKLTAQPHESQKNRSYKDPRSSEP